MKIVMILLGMLGMIVTVMSYSSYDRLLSKYELSHDLNASEMMNVVIGQLSAIHVIKGDEGDNNNQIETLFFITPRNEEKIEKNDYKKMMMIVLTRDEEYYLVSSEKTLYIPHEDYTNLVEHYKFLYYEMMDQTSKITLSDVEDLLSQIYH